MKGTKPQLGLMATVFECYRKNFLLFWRIMIPIAGVALVLSIALRLWIDSSYIPKLKDRMIKERIDFDTVSHKITSSASTDWGITFVTLLPKIDTPADSSENVLINPVHPPGERRWLLFPPIFVTTNNEGITWKWRLSFKSLSYGYMDPLSLLLLTLCPLSLAIAHISRRSDVPGVLQNQMLLTAGEVWRQTRRKGFTILGAFLFCVLILRAIKVIDDSISPGLLMWLVMRLGPKIPTQLVGLLWCLSSGPFILLKVYFLVTMSLYNSCLILENNSIIGIFRRSHTLVCGARWRFLGIYLLTGWIASIVSSVLTGVALLMFSVFVPNLAVVRVALSPLRFLTLFIGADIVVVLPQLLSVPITLAIYVVETLIHIFLVPIWAILTTHFYLERADAQQHVIKT